VERANGGARAWQEAGNGSAPQGGPDAFTAAFTRLAPGLYDFLARLSGRPEAADALLRQAASQAAMSVASAPQWPSVRAWFYARAVAVLPAESSGANADPAPFSNPDPARLPAVPPDSGLSDMARVVWRAVSALSIEQHALLHLCSREGMAPGEAASVLGITASEATGRLGRVVTAVEETSRALFLIRYGRTRDPHLNELLADRNVTRLTPELRGFLDTYLRTSPSAQAMLHAVPAPLAIYTAFRPLPVPEGLTASAASGALPWLAAASASPPTVGATNQTGVMPDGGGGTPYLSQAAPSAFDPRGATAVNGAYGYGPDGQTVYTPAVPPVGYDPQTYGAGAYDSYGYGASTGYSAPPVGSGQIEGTQSLDIPVRQRVVANQSAMYMPPSRPQWGINPRAIIGGVGGALVVIIGALIIFLSRGTGQPAALVTASTGATMTSTALPVVFSSDVPEALLTSTAIAANRLLTATAMVAVTPTAIATSSPPPQLIRTAAPDSATATALASAMASGEPSTPFPTPMPRVTQAPVDTQSPRVTPIPTHAVPTTAPTAMTTATTAATARATTGVINATATRIAVTTSVAATLTTGTTMAGITPPPTIAATAAATASAAPAVVSPTAAAITVPTAITIPAPAPTMPASAPAPSVVVTSVATAKPVTPAGTPVPAGATKPATPQASPPR